MTKTACRKMERDSYENYILFLLAPNGELHKLRNNRAISLNTHKWKYVTSFITFSALVPLSRHISLSICRSIDYIPSPQMSCANNHLLQRRFTSLYTHKLQYRDICKSHHNGSHIWESLRVWRQQIDQNTKRDLSNVRSRMRSHN